MRKERKWFRWQWKSLFSVSWFLSFHEWVKGEVSLSRASLVPGQETRNESLYTVFMKLRRKHNTQERKKKKSDEEESIIPCKPVFNCCNKGNAEESFSMMMVTLGVSFGRELLCFSFSSLYLSPPFLFYKLDRSRKERRKRSFLQESSSWKSSLLSLVKQLLSPSTQHFSRAQELVPVGTCLTSLSLSSIPWSSI